MFVGLYFSLEIVEFWNEVVEELGVDGKGDSDALWAGVGYSG